MSEKSQNQIHQPDDKTELSALVRWCIMLAQQSKWAEVSNISKRLLRQFPENLSIAELFISATVKLRDWQALNEHYDAYPEHRCASQLLSISLFDFYALNGRYDDLIVHVWDCISAGGNDELLGYVNSSLIAICGSDPALGFALSNLTGDQRLSPLGRIIDSFSDMLIARDQTPLRTKTLHFREIAKQPAIAFNYPDMIIEMPSDEILNPHRLVELALSRNFGGNRDDIIEVDVVIPIHSGFKETMRCIASVLLSSQSRSFSIIAVDDCTPDAKIANALDILSKAGLIDLHRNSVNLGFVLSCNYAVALHPERDIILLNSDTEVTGDWIDRILKHAENVPDAGTITPFSNNATICSYPHFAMDNIVANGRDISILDQIAGSENATADLIEIPTGVGFCMYIRRACIGERQLFDYEAFGMGYGEENDFCRRIKESGYKNYLAPNIFVYHAGATSFNNTSDARKRAAMLTLRDMHPSYDREITNHLEQDPARDFRAKIDVERLRRAIAFSKGAILHITHRLGGGTEKHVRELCELTNAEGYICLIARPLNDKSGRFEVLPFDDDTFPNLPTFSCFESVDDLVAFSLHIGLKHFHIHHLFGYGHSAPQYFEKASSHIITDFTVHDYFPICARINLVDGSGKYCGEPSIGTCQTCITQFGSHVPPYVAADDWRKSNMQLLKNMRRIFVPSSDCGSRLARYLSHDNILVRAHPMQTGLEVSSFQQEDPPNLMKISPTMRRVAILGALNSIKGAKIIAEVAAAAKALSLPLTFHVIGYFDSSDQVAALENVFVTGKYTKEELPTLISLVDADYMWIPSIWPETFCYALIEGICAGLMPVSFDIGAQAERIRDLEWGITIPLNLQDKPLELAMILYSVVVEHSEKFRLDDFSFLGFERYYDLST